MSVTLGMSGIDVPRGDTIFLKIVSKVPFKLTAVIGLYPLNSEGSHLQESLNKVQAVKTVKGGIGPTEGKPGLQVYSREEVSLYSLKEDGYGIYPRLYPQGSGVDSLSFLASFLLFLDDESI